MRWFLVGVIVHLVSLGFVFKGSFFFLFAFSFLKCFFFFFFLLLSFRSSKVWIHNFFCVLDWKFKKIPQTLRKN